MTTPPKIRFVTRGQVSAAPAGTTAAEAVGFADGGADRLSLSYYASPSPEQLAELGAAWQLHPVVQEDIVLGGQRPKVERSGDVLFLVLRSAHYVDELESVEFGELHVLMRPNAVAMLCQSVQEPENPDAPDATVAHPFFPFHSDDSLLAKTNPLDFGPEAVVYRIIDAIVDRYEPVLRGLEIDKEQIERQVFDGDAAVAERIYRLSREVIAMQQTVSSMTEVIDSLMAGVDKYEVPDGLQQYLDDIADHLAHAAKHIRAQREALGQMLNVNATLVAQRQNEDMKKISGWAAILFAPTLIGSIYGMNFRQMPELHWLLGYPLSLAAMLLFSVVLYIVFKKSKWM